MLPIINQKTINALTCLTHSEYHEECHRKRAGINCITKTASVGTRQNTLCTVFLQLSLFTLFPSLRSCPFHRLFQDLQGFPPLLLLLLLERHQFVTFAIHLSSTADLTCPYEVSHFSSVHLSTLFSIFILLLVSSSVTLSIWNFYSSALPFLLQFFIMTQISALYVIMLRIVILNVVALVLLVMYIL